MRIQTSKAFQNNQPQFPAPQPTSTASDTCAMQNLSIPQRRTRQTEWKLCKEESQCFSSPPFPSPLAVKRLSSRLVSYESQTINHEKLISKHDMLAHTVSTCALANNTDTIFLPMLRFVYHDMSSDLVKEQLIPLCTRNCLFAKKRKCEQHIPRNSINRHCTEFSRALQEKQIGASIVLIGTRVNKHSGSGLGGLSCLIMQGLFFFLWFCFERL